MSAAVEDRRQNAYLTATTLSQAELDETFRGGENQIETIATFTKTIGATTYTLRFADRPKFVGDNFFEGRAQFPTIKRTMGELQNPAIQFSEMEVVLANVDGFYNQYLEGGASYLSFIGGRLVVEICLRDIDASRITIFDGIVPQEGGFTVERNDIKIKARDKADSLNVASPLPYLNLTDFPSAPQDSIGKIIPMALGDWEAGYNYTAKARSVSVSDGVQPTPTNADVWSDAPLNFYGGLKGYNVGGGFFVFSIGNYTPDTIAQVHIKRGNDMLQTIFNATPQNTAGYWSVHVTDLIQSDIGSTPFTYAYQSGDIAMISVKIPYATGKYSNAVEIAQQILYTLGGKSSGDLDAASWAALAAKAAPPQSAIATIKTRFGVWADGKTVLGLARGFLETVRIELFVDNAGKIHLSAMHPEDWIAPASMDRIEQIEVNEETMIATADERTFFNNAALNYGYTPITDKTELKTVRKKNQNSIDLSGKEVLKDIDVGWLYVEAEADYQLIEFLRFYSTGLVFVEVEAAWVHLLRDLSTLMSFNYNIGSIAYDAAPMMIRNAGVNPKSGSVQLKLLSLANFYYASYTPANEARFLSGASQSIVDA